MTRSRSYHRQLSSLASLALVASIATSLMLVGCKKKVDKQPPTTASSGDELTKLPGCRDQLLVQVAYPGASPVEVENGILLELDDVIASVKGVREVHGFAREGAAKIVIELAELDAGPDAEAADRRRVTDEVRAALDRITTFPAEAERPMLVQQPTSDRFVALSLFGPLDPFELRSSANRIRDGLLAQEEILGVEVVGAPRREMRVNADPTKLQMYGISARAVSQAVSSFTLERPSRALLTVSEMPKVEELGNIVVGVRASVPVYLKDIAEIEVGFERMPIASMAGERALLLVVRPAPDIADANFSALVAKHISSASLPATRAVASETIRASYCAVGAPEVSGAIVMLEVSADASTIGRLVPGLVEGDRPALLLEGASLLAFGRGSAGVTEVVGFPRAGVSASETLDQWQREFREVPGVSTVALAPRLQFIFAQLQHKDLEVLDRAAQQLQVALGTGPAKHLSTFPSGEKAELNMQVDREALARYGVTSTDVARTIRMAMYGETLARFQDDRDEAAVVLRLGDELRPHSAESAEQLLALQVSTPKGAVPLGQLMTLERRLGPSEIYRRDGHRQIILQIAVDSGKEKQEVERALESKIFAQLREGNPGLTVTLGE